MWRRERWPTKSQGRRRALERGSRLRLDGTSWREREMRLDQPLSRTLELHGVLTSLPELVKGTRCIRSAPRRLGGTCASSRTVDQLRDTATGGRTWHHLPVSVHLPVTRRSPPGNDGHSRSARWLLPRHTWLSALRMSTSLSLARKEGFAKTTALEAVASPPPTCSTTA